MAVREKGLEPVVIWFRQDLRLTDHAALEAALQAARATGGAVVPVYVLDDETAGDWRWGGASRWWLHHSLASLGRDLAAAGAPLVLRRGRAVEVLPALMRDVGATAIHAGRMHENWAREAETALAAALPAGALRLHRTTTLFDPDTIRTKTGGVYGVYTPFAKSVRGRGDPAPVIPAPDAIPGLAGVASDRLEDWALLPRAPDWAGGFAWTPGEASAQKRLAQFADKALHGYDTGRNLPGQDGTSMLSAPLHWGELSPGQVWHAAMAGSEGRNSEGRGVYLGEILWREFAAYQLWHYPDMPEKPLRPRFAALPFRTAPKELEAWQQGRTGVPIVDAGMRQLWQLGWMHNRVRMIVASFLVKHLLIDWRAGEDHFWDTLIDADLASNAVSWQWVAGSGIDSQPWFRVFNPVSQGEKFDPAGAYVRRWVPELKRLHDKFIHAPWTAPKPFLGGIVLGRDYPMPLLDLAEGRNRALATYRATLKGSPDAEDAEPGEAA